MLIDQLKKSKFYPALCLERWFNTWRRRQALGFLLTLLLFSLAGGIFWRLPRLSGVGIIALDLLIIIQCLDWFYRFYYFKRLLPVKDNLDPLAGQFILAASIKGDYLAAFGASPFGSRLLLRLGISQEKFSSLLLPEREMIVDLPAPLEARLDWPLLASLLFNASAPLKKLCAEEGITAADFNTVALVVEWEYDQVDTKRQWWSRAAFDALPTIGADWAYGQRFWLQRYTREVEFYDGGLEPVDESALSRLETVLARSRGANALIVSRAGDEGLNLLAALSRRARSSQAPVTIQGKHFLVLAVSPFLANFAERHQCETALIALFEEAVRAGNVVVVIDNLNVLLTGMRNLGTDLPGLLEPYLTHPSFQIVAIAETREFNDKIASLAAITEQFELIRLDGGKNSDNLLGALRAAKVIEDEYNLLFTYRAIKELARAAESYFASEGAPSSELADLLIEIAPWLSARRITLVSRENVLDYLREKTQIPQGAVSAEEKSQLLNLESILHQRIIGQAEAVKVVAEAMRRARADLKREDKPIASFLFLGPTGVGKTETAKALAATMFKSEERLLRVDMSEYGAEDSLDRLVTNLGALVRANPYGVILFDEFEKSHLKVRNLFLQILDEGFFSDQLGKRVLLREHLLIATSNAGAEMIWDLVKENKSLAAATDELIDALVHQAVFTPELLNRFDATIIFKPLTNPELILIATKLLATLAEKLAGEGVKLVVTKDLAQTVATKGANKVFGARPMQRFIQDSLEDQIAKGLLTGTISRGQEISFDPATLILNEKK